MPRSKNTISKKDEDDNKKYFDIIAPNENLSQDQSDDQPEEQQEGVIKIRKEHFATSHNKEERFEQDTNEILDKEPSEENISIPEVTSSSYRERFETEKEREEDMGLKASSIFQEETEIEGNYEKKGSSKRFSFKIKNKVLKVSVVCFVVLGLIASLYTFVFNKADIIITTKKSNIKYEGIVLADINAKAVDVSKGIIPGKLISFSKTIDKEFEATGKVTGGSKAHGTMIIYNAYSQAPQVLVTGTRFESADGLIFKLDARTVVPGATLKNGEIVPVSIEASVTAAEAGAAYNIAPGRFTIPGFEGTDKFKGFYGETKTKMTGGSDGESIVVSQGDIKNAENVITDELFKVLNEELNKQISKDERVFKEAVVTKVGNITPNVKVGDSVAKFKVSVSGEIQTIIIANKDLDELVKQNLSSALLPIDQLYSHPEYIFSNLKLDIDKGTLSFYVICDYPVKKSLNKEEIIGQIKGKTIEEVKKLLSNNEKIENTKIKLSPF